MDDKDYMEIPEGYETTDKPPRACLECLGTGFSDLTEVECQHCKGTGYALKKKDG